MGSAKTSKAVSGTTAKHNRAVSDTWPRLLGFARPECLRFTGLVRNGSAGWVWLSLLTSSLKHPKPTLDTTN